MALKVVAFNGSPHQHGNTFLLLQVVLDSLQQHNIQTELIHVGANQVQGCIACGACRKLKNKRCILQSDSVNSWIEKMSLADGIIIGSPVFFSDLSGQLKSFLDRAFFVANANEQMLQRKVGAGVVAVRRAGAIHTLNSINAYFTISQMLVVGSSYWNMGFGMEAGEALKDAEGVQTMRNLGSNMSWLLHTLAAAKNIVEPPQTSLQSRTNFIRADL